MFSVFPWAFLISTCLLKRKKLRNTFIINKDRNASLISCRCILLKRLIRLYHVSQWNRDKQRRSLSMLEQTTKAEGNDGWTKLQEKYEHHKHVIRNQTVVVGRVTIAQRWQQRRREEWHAGAMGDLTTSLWRRGPSEIWGICGKTDATQDTEDYACTSHQRQLCSHERT